MMPTQTVPVPFTVRKCKAAWQSAQELAAKAEREMESCAPDTERREKWHEAAHALRYAMDNLAEAEEALYLAETLNG